MLTISHLQETSERVSPTIGDTTYKCQTISECRRSGGRCTTADRPPVGRVRSARWRERCSAFQIGSASSGHETTKARNGSLYECSCLRGLMTCGGAVKSDRAGADSIFV